MGQAHHGRLGRIHHRPVLPVQSDQGGLTVSTLTALAKVSSPWWCKRCGSTVRSAYMAPAKGGSKIHAKCEQCGVKAVGGQWSGAPIYGRFYISQSGEVL